MMKFLPIISFVSVTDQS